MSLGRASRFVIGFIILASLGLRASAANGQQPPDQPAFRQLANIEVAFPNQLVRGQANIVHVAIQSAATFTGAYSDPGAADTHTARWTFAGGDAAVSCAGAVNAAAKTVAIFTGSVIMPAPVGTPIRFQPFFRSTGGALVGADPVMLLDLVIAGIMVI